MKKETHETSRDNWVANPNIPSDPLSFKPIERRKVGTVIELFCNVRAQGRGNIQEAHGDKALARWSVTRRKFWRKERQAWEIQGKRFLIYIH